jgi:transposase
MPQTTRLVGLDVSKRKVDACIGSLDLRLSTPSTADGQAAMIAWLRANDVWLAVMEASGGYEQPWAQALHDAGIAVRIVDPKRVRYFAKSAGKLAKNDPIDAAMIARFAETFRDALDQPLEPKNEELDRLLTARAGLLRMQTQIENQGEHRQPRTIAAAHRAILRTLRTQLAKLEAAIAASIKADPRAARRAEIVESVPGLGAQAAAGLLAWLPELGRISDKAAAALVGIAPYDDDSGERKGKRIIKGGRRKLRNLLYMPTMGAATQHNPVLKAYYQRLRANGKEAKVALVACMRKLIVILNTMLARNQTWNPPAPAAAGSAAVPRGRRFAPTA